VPVSVSASESASGPTSESCAESASIGPTSTPNAAGDSASEDGEIGHERTRARPPPERPGGHGMAAVTEGPRKGPGGHGMAGRYGMARRSRKVPAVHGNGG